jgi:hypothetical protein
MLDQHRWQDDAALAIEGKLPGIGKEGGGQIVMLVGEQVDRIQILADLGQPGEIAAVDRPMLERGRSAMAGL